MTASDEHFPWSYTTYGVLCVCGESMTAQETCPADPTTSDDSEAKR